MSATGTQFSLEHATHETLAGDIRDFLLTHIRSMPDAWVKLSEQAQEDKVDAAGRAAEDVIRKVVHLVAQRGFDHVPVLLGKMTINDGVKQEFTASSDFAVIEKLAGHGKQVATLVLCSTAGYMGEKAPPHIDKDQPSLLDQENDEGAVFDNTSAGRND